MTTPVINLYRTKDEAFHFKNSQINNYYLFGGVQLLPNNPNAYIQVTDTPNGIDLEDWVVKVFTIDDSVSHDITAQFNVIGLTNSVNGDPQIIWELKNVPFDMGYRLVYLEVQQVLGEFFYSNPFMLTNIYSEKTTQFHYREKKTDVYQSIGFKTWFRQYDEKIELQTYYETSTQHTVTQSIQVNYIDTYKTEPMALHELRKLSLILRMPYLYVDLIRASLFEAIAFPKTEASQNFAAFEYQLSLKENDKFEL